MARPSKLTPELQRVLVDRIKAGSYSAQAAVSAGISERTFFNWMRDGRVAEAKLEEGHKLRADEKRKLQFLQAIKEAEAHAEIVAVAQIRKAGLDSWQASAWFLERKFPNRWSRREKHEIETSVKDTSSPKTPEELLQELQELENKGG